jgi:hypothetical protein
MYPSDLINKTRKFYTNIIIIIWTTTCTTCVPVNVVYYMFSVAIQYTYVLTIL